jgi:hypothetical protein
MKRTIITSFMLLGGLVVALPGSAAAEDAKSFHASQCLPMDGVESDWSRTEYRISRTGAAGNGNLLCPVLRDVWDCGFLGCVAITDMQVRVYDASVAGDVSCSFSARNETGSSVYYDTDSTTLAGGHDTLEMSIGWPTGDGTYTLKCSTPTNGAQGTTKIFGYSVDEGS